MATQKPHILQKSNKAFWTHRSVVEFAQGRDPIETMISAASSVALEAIQAGWSGPPFDPFLLAEHIKVRVVPSDAVGDARILVEKDGRYQIEFNPNRPKGRIRYSVAHELAHILFSDCSDVIRYRASCEEQVGDEWQLEMLCNVGAAEFLMPIGHFPDLKEETTKIDELLKLRAKFEVSMEALLLRVIRLSEQPCAMFAASRVESGNDVGRYRVDYWVPSRTWPVKLVNGCFIQDTKSLTECTAIGFTSKGDESWPKPAGSVHVEAVGVAPYPSRTYPRVVGMACPLNPQRLKAASVTTVRGDATELRGQGTRILAHVVNDKAMLWGAGFGLAVRKKWPKVQSAFRDWATTNPDQFKLGNVFMSHVNQDIVVFQMICQRGYGPSPKPRLRYAALRSCLEKLGQNAEKQQASIHMPRIGTGHAGGSWNIIVELVDEVLCSRGLHVTLYELPNAPADSGDRGQFSLFDQKG